MVSKDRLTQTLAEKFEVRPLKSKAEAEQFGALLGQGFIADSRVETQELGQIGYPYGRLLFIANQLAGGLAQLPMGQWFGGRQVRMTGIASVTIAPEFRGVGAAKYLMQQCLQELHQKRIALSTLYPATQALYKRMGYGQAGTRYAWQVPTAAIRLNSRPLPARPLEPTLDTLQTLYRQQSQIHSGCLERHPMIWQRLLRTDLEQSLYCYGFGPVQRLEGYILFTQTHTPEGSILNIRDWVTLSGEAAQSFWSFLASHQSQIDKVRWFSSAVDGLSRLLSEQVAAVISGERWMTRIVSVPEALSQRGYPPVSTELNLEVEDPILPANSGRFRLKIDSGKGTVQPGGLGDLKLSISTLATLYSGFFSAQQLYAQGALAGSSMALETAALLFSGGSPWMGDFF